MSNLFLVPTPIGNLKDITLRALDILRSTDLILAEDTRHARKLLKHYQIDTPCQSHHAFNEHKKIESLCSRIEGGENIALISDAGTPAISDPGFLLVRSCIARGINVITLPGPTALIPALVSSGLPCDRFCFEGFLPHKKGRKKRIEELANEKKTIVLFESPHRLIKTLEELAAALGPGRKACVSREISKIYEENIRGTLAYLLEHFSGKKPRGEMVITIAGGE